MKKLISSIVFISLTIWLPSIANAQGVGINSTNSPPAPSAILDASSTNKGLLVPRMTTAQRDSITSPAQSLLIYNTTTRCFETYELGLWQSIWCSCAPPTQPVTGTLVPSQTQIVWNWTTAAGSSYKYNTVNNYGSATDNGTSGTYTQTGLTCNTPCTLFVWAYNPCGVATVTMLTHSTLSCCINVWSQKLNVGGTTRQSAIGFSIGTKGYIGTGYDGGGAYYKDFWEWDQASGLWTQKADLPVFKYAAVGFSIGTKGYIGTGYDGSTWKQDFYEWNQANNQWSAKANFGGTPRRNAVGFSIGTKGYIGTGADANGFTQDFWEYDPTGDTWSQKAPLTGTARFIAVGFSMGTKGYIGTGYDGTIRKDFWEWDQTNNTWAQKTDFGGTARYSAVGFSINGKGYIGTGFDNAYTVDYWEWDPSINTWTKKADFGGSPREGGVGFSIGTKGYIGTGYDPVNKDDFFEWCQ